MKNNGIKNVVATGIGTALFVALTTVQIPIGIPNTYLQPRMAILAFFSMIFGPVVGGIIGLLGHALGDAIFYGSVWWSWVVPELFVGVGIGLFVKLYGVRDGKFGVKQMITFNLAQIFANAVAWILVAPALDILIYAEPSDKVFIQGAYAFLGNVIIIGILGTVLASVYSGISAKSGSLSKED